MNNRRLGNVPLPDPTPEEVARRIEAIRAGWTPEEERRRSKASRARPWTAPLVKVAIGGRQPLDGK